MKTFQEYIVEQSIGLTDAMAADNETLINALLGNSKRIPQAVAKSMLAKKGFDFATFANKLKQIASKIIKNKTGAQL